MGGSIHPLSCQQLTCQWHYAGRADENVRNVAGMILAKSGGAAIPVLHRALIEQRNMPEVLALLGDIGDESVERDLARYVSHRDEAIARAATDALRALALRHGGGSS